MDLSPSSAEDCESSSSLTPASQVSEEPPFLQLTIRPRQFHFHRLRVSVLLSTRAEAQVLLDRPYSILELFLGSRALGAWIFLFTDLREWRSLSLCSREARVCAAHHLFLEQ